MSTQVVEVRYYGRFANSIFCGLAIAAVVIAWFEFRILTMEFEGPEPYRSILPTPGLNEPPPEIIIDDPAGLSFHESTSAKNW